MADQAPTQLTEKEINALREVHVPVNLSGFFKAWNYATYKKPFELYQGAARKVEGFSKELMTGKRAVLGLPLGIILRNTSRAAHNASDDRYYHVAPAAGVLATIGAVGAATLIAGPVIAAAAPAVIAGAAATVVGYGAALAVSGLLLHRPAFTTATLAASTALAAGAAVFSTAISAPANLLVGWRRSRASAKGIKLTADQIAAQEAAFDRNSPSARYAREMEADVRGNLSRLPNETKKEIFLSLKAEFEPAAATAEKPAVEKKPAVQKKPKGPQA